MKMELLDELTRSAGLDDCYAHLQFRAGWRTLLSLQTEFKIHVRGGLSFSVSPISLVPSPRGLLSGKERLNSVVGGDEGEPPRLVLSESI